MIPIVRRLAMLAGAALASVGLLGVTGGLASPQQEVCVSVYAEVNGEVLVDQAACLPPA